jgi:hypothetical protein
MRFTFPNFFAFLDEPPPAPPPKKELREMLYKQTVDELGAHFQDGDMSHNKELLYQHVVKAMHEYETSKE